jgi:hypothetical protein
MCLITVFYGKKFFTNYNQLSLFETVRMVCEELIPFFINDEKVFQIYRKPDPEIKKMAAKLNINQFKKINDNFIYYYGFNHVHLINISKRSCTCYYNHAYSI